VYYVPFYQWLCAITVHLIPCIVMTVCIFLLIYAIRLSYLRRKRVFINSRTASIIRKIEEFIDMYQCGTNINDYGVLQKSINFKPHKSTKWPSKTEKSLYTIHDNLPHARCEEVYNAGMSIHWNSIISIVC
jgi:hypothetical protein